MESQREQARMMEAISTLAGGIAHRFNNNLHIITGYIDLLKMNLPDNEKIDKYIEPVRASVCRMSHLTNQFLAFAREGKYQPKVLSLTDFVAESLLLIQHSINYGIHIETDLAIDVSHVEADFTQMQMVLSALLDNAQEAIKAEGLIQISTRNEDIGEDFAGRPAGLEPGCYACLTIKDNGKGMDEETKDRIFEPFFTTKIQGRGFGMAAVYGIVKNHDGWIRVDSELWKGTAVRIYLPSINGRA